MDANIQHQNGSIYRIEEVNITDLVNLLTRVFAFSDTANLIVDVEKKEIYVEAPDHVSDEDEMKMHDSMIVPLDEVIITDEMLELLKKQ